MKKTFVLFVLVTLAASGVFAQTDFRISIGGGGYFTSDFGGGGEASTFGMPVSYKTPYAGGGGFIFFDATYAELSLGFFGGGGTWEAKQGVSLEYDVSVTGLDIGLLAKYPFAINEKLTLFPLLGITYRAALEVKLDGTKKDDPGDYSALWFKLGCGLDYFFTGNVFFRGSLLYGIRLENQFEKDFADTPALTSTKSLLGHGLEIKLAVGYRF